VKVGSVYVPAVAPGAAGKVIADIVDPVGRVPVTFKAALRATAIAVALASPTSAFAAAKEVASVDTSALVKAVVLVLSAAAFKRSAQVNSAAYFIVNAGTVRTVAPKAVTVKVGSVYVPAAVPGAVGKVIEDIVDPAGRVPVTFKPVLRAVAIAVALASPTSAFAAAKEVASVDTSALVKAVVLVLSAAAFKRSAQVNSAAYLIVNAGTVRTVASATITLKVGSVYVPAAVPGAAGKVIADIVAPVGRDPVTFKAALRATAIAVALASPTSAFALAKAVASVTASALVKAVVLVLSAAAFKRSAQVDSALVVLVPQATAVVATAAMLVTDRVEISNFFNKFFFIFILLNIFNLHF
jgi:hypothetical protein